MCLDIKHTYNRRVLLVLLKNRLFYELVTFHLIRFLIRFRMTVTCKTISFRQNP